MMSAETTLSDLAFQISGLTYNVSKFLEENKLPTPSYIAGGYPKFPTSVSPEIRAARQKLLQLTQDLHNLVLGPEDRVRQHATEYTNSASLRWIQHFKIPEHVPQDGSITYSDLAASASVPEQQLKRIVRYTMLNGYFTEPVAGSVAHSAMSLLLASSPHIQDYVNHAIEFSYPVSTKMVEMTERFHGTDAMDQTAFNVAFDTPLPMFGWLKGEKEHSERFGRLMGAMKASPTWSAQHLVNGYDWSCVGDGKVVDVGGSLGHASLAVAEKYPNLTFVVQDLDDVVKQGKAKLPETGTVKLEFMPHDFFKEQPIQDADIYLLRQILHDWNDAQATLILKNLVASMKSGSKIVVMDQVVPPPGLLSNAQERAARTVDLVVMSHFNGKQRDIEDWKKIFAAVDEKLVISKVNIQAESVLSIIELSLKDARLTDGHAVAEENVVTTAVAPDVEVIAKSKDIPTTPQPEDTIASNAEGIPVEMQHPETVAPEVEETASGVVAEDAVTPIPDPKSTEVVTEAEIAPQIDEKSKGVHLEHAMNGSHQPSLVGAA